MVTQLRFLSFVINVIIVNSPSEELAIDLAYSYVSVDSNLIVPTDSFSLCCAVICNGLISAPRLNGELGGVRNMKLELLDGSAYWEEGSEVSSSRH